MAAPWPVELTFDKDDDDEDDGAAAAAVATVRAAAAAAALAVLEAAFGKNGRSVSMAGVIVSYTFRDERSHIEMPSRSRSKRSSRRMMAP